MNLNPNRGEGGRGPWLIWTGIALILMLAHALSFRFVIDDAFISFRYAQNLVDGHGLVFNIGERVEGYSNFLYVLWSAVGIRLGVDALLWGRIWSTLAMGGLLAMLPGILRQLAPEENAHRALPGKVAQMLMALSGAVACWMLAGLETVFFAFFAVWAWRSALKRQSFLAGIAGLLLILTSPLMLLTAILVKLTSKGPVLYRQARMGKGGLEFDVLKFRSMAVDAEDRSGPTFAKEFDPRVTFMGRLMRPTRIDELPQLFNVLRGEMSFVGPRPERRHFVRRLEEKIPYFGLRLTVRPGLTGWAQVEYRYGATDEDSLEKLKYDLYYIKNANMLFDLWIVVKTIKVVLLGSGAR